MNLDQIKELIALMRKHRISEIDLEQKGSKIRIVAEPARAPAPEPSAADARVAPYLPDAVTSAANRAAAPAPMSAAAQEAAKPAQTSLSTPEPTKEAPSTNLTEVKSPMPGTFYRAPAPDAPPYVDVGSVIKKDTVLCIIEAMKLMNEIKAETPGHVVKILVENGHPVEYGQPLFLLEPV